MRFLYPAIAGLFATHMQHVMSASEQCPAGQVCNMPVETYGFTAEMSRLMDIIVNSLYKDKEVFLREIVSNGNDALEKARYHAVSDSEYLNAARDLEIRIEVDEDAKTMTITDTGVGMTKADLINNLGTVAKSGTTSFVEKMSQSGATGSDLIGQFGVGFYSVFLVADKVRVESKNNEDPVQHVWESSAASSYTVSDDVDGEPLTRGTRITLFFKDDSVEFLQVQKVKDLVRKFSQFIAFPIKVKVSKEVSEEMEVDEEESTTEEKTNDDDDLDVSDEDEEQKEKTKTVTKTIYEWEIINSQKPIWLRPRDEITEEDYFNFYKAITKDYQDPLAYTHFNAEGQTEFKSVLFIPRKAPHDLMDKYWKKEHDIKLYVRRVMVADKMDDLLPAYLGFVRGVVDSDDLPLNVNRDQLQQSKVLKVITKRLVKKVLDLLGDMAKESDAIRNGEESAGEEFSSSGDTEGERTTRSKRELKEGDKTDWETFYSGFSSHIKLGCYEDETHRQKIAKLLRFNSWKHPEVGNFTSLDDYVKNLPSGVSSIYYMSGESIEVMQKSAVLQAFKKRDIDVLLLTDNLDEPCVSRLTDFAGKKFVSIQKSDVKIPETEDEKTRFNKLKKMYKPLVNWWKDTLNNSETLGAKIEKVVISKRLVESPCVVVSSQYGYSAIQERVMKAQAFTRKDELSLFVGRKNLEVNPNHPIIADLLKRVQENKEDPIAVDTAIVLFQGALLEAGYDLSDPSPIVSKMYRLMSDQLGVNPDAEVVDVEIPESVDSMPEVKDDEEANDEIDFDSLNFEDDFDLTDDEFGGNSPNKHGDEL